MAHELVIEAARLSKEISFMLRQAPPDSEIPMRLHSKETDAGGAPELHPAFVRFIGAVCSCGRAAICAPACHFLRDKVLGHLDECEPACRTNERFRASKHHNSPTRMNRALRSLRKLNPKAYDLLFLMVARGLSFDQASARINDDHARRGQPEMTPAQMAVVYVSGSALLAATF